MANASRVAQAAALGATPLQARLVAARIPEDSIDLAHFFDPRSHVISWRQLPDIHAAADCIADAIEQGEHIACVVDHDADGITSHCVLWEALTLCMGVPVDRIHSVTSHRTKEGYGVSSKLVERVLQLVPRPALVITADQGSTDEPRIRELLEKGIKTVVSDHHGLPKEGPPASAVACVNPARTDVPASDPNIAGCMVAMLLMAATRDKLIERGTLPTDAPSLARVMDAVAIGTTADAVDLGRSATNRFIVRAGLKRMNALQRPFLKALSEVEPPPWDSQTIAYRLGPVCNAHGRIDDATAGLEALTTPHLERARELVAILRDANERRKVIEKRVTAQAMALASDAVAQGCIGLALILPDGHPGVHGISSSRVVEAWGRPTVCLSPHMEDAQVLTGSVRSVPGFHVREALESIATNHPELELLAGGHAGAGGVRLPASRGLLFCAIWDATVSAAFQGKAPPIEKFHDGALGHELGPQALAEIEALDPWGRGFELPVFCDTFQLLGIKPVGDGTHLRLEMTDVKGRRWNAIWFRAIEAGQVPPLAPGAVRIVYRLQRPGPRSTQAVEIHVQAASNVVQTPIN